MPSRLLTPLLLIALGLAFFWPLVLNPTAVLYAPRSDLIAQHLPAKLFLVDSMRETGERPLWCPYRFCGDPFVADVQVAAFYPPHLLLPLFSRDHIGAFLSWLIVLHVLAAGLCAFAYARHDGLGPLGSFVAGVGYMFAGKWLLHLLAGGHYIVIGLAWFPLVLLCFERALRRRSLGWATAAGTTFALLALGTHPQWVVYAALLAAAWTAPAALEPARSARAACSGLFLWARFGLWAAAVAAALGAIQFLPAREAGALSGRARDSILSFFRDDGITSLRSLVGPSPGDVSWEGVYGVGLTWAMVAAAAMATARFLPGRPRLYVWAALGVTMFAICRGGPAQLCPVLCRFRNHFRAFVLVALPLAMLAGALTDRCAAPLAPSPVLRRRLFLWMSGAGFACLVGAAWNALYTDRPLVPQLYWFTLPLTFPILLWLVRSSGPWQKGWGASAWCGVLVIDAFTLACPIVEVRDQAELYRSSPCVTFLTGRREDHGRVLDLFAPGQPLKTPLGSGAPLAMTQGLEAVRGYNPLDVARFRDFMQFIADRNEPPHPNELLVDTPEMNPTLFNLLGVRYRLVADGTPAPGPGWRPVFRDAAPLPAFHHEEGGGGFPLLPPYTVFEKEHALPRAFVVPDARRFPADPNLPATLKHVDFRQTVLLDHFHRIASSSPGGSFRPARIMCYRPNCVTIDADAGAGGWLVLTDVWHPGWRSTVDGRDAQLFRANHTFRAVELPAGRHEIVFTFDPISYRRGRAITFTALGVMALLTLIAALRKMRQLSLASAQPPSIARCAA